MEEKKCNKSMTYIGGQAVLEGVMMRGKTAMATAVRDPDGVIQIEAVRVKPPEKKSKFSRLPFVRGVYSFLDSLIGGSKVLMRSAEVLGGEEAEEPSKTEKWLAEKLHVDPMTVLSTVSMILGLLLSLALFFFLPVAITGFFSSLAPEVIPTGGILYNLISGLIRIVIFILYIALTSLMKEMRRTYMYHGAEHKTISCYEYGMPLTVENVKKCTRVHDRCGTTFLFLVMVVSILIFALITAVIRAIPVVGDFFNETGDSALHKISANLIMFLIHVVFLPLVAGTSYEVLRLLARSQAKWLVVFKAPGLALQRLTTREPDDDMIECAIAAFEKVLAMDADPAIPECYFPLPEQSGELLARLRKTFAQSGIEEEEADWIVSMTMGISRSELSQQRLIDKNHVEKINRIVAERLTGRPLWYIMGDASFCGYPIKVDERVLIPRPETEELVEYAGKLVTEKTKKALDLCTGSGAIAIAFKKRLKEGQEVEVTASDISEDALSLARENAEANGAEIKFIHSDLFERVKGKFDLILSNPPYIKTEEIATLQREVKDFEPKIALDGGADGLELYRRIAKDAPAHLKKGGILLMECGMGQAQDIVKLFSACESKEVICDLNGVERFVKVVF